MVLPDAMVAEPAVDEYDQFAGSTLLVGERRSVHLDDGHGIGLPG
jgi:hypothetical protein